MKRFDLSTFNTSSVPECTSLFKLCNSFSLIDLTSFSLRPDLKNLEEIVYSHDGSFGSKLL